ncbi:MAG: hypothetical protein MRY74_02955 [Neomegalonema sp.]|nr:hypothetical protein [Neomegalonema sp.]
MARVPLARILTSPRLSVLGATFLRALSPSGGGATAPVAYLAENHARRVVAFYTKEIRRDAGNAKPACPVATGRAKGSGGRNIGNPLRWEKMMTVANRAALFDMAIALLQGADAAARDAAVEPRRKGLQLIAPSGVATARGEPVRRDRRAPGQGSFHLVAESAERARLMRAESAAAGCAHRLGWRAVAVGAPSVGPEAAARLDLEVALEERPAALIALGWFPEGDGGAAAAERDAAYIEMLRAAAAGRPVWAMAANRQAGGGFRATLTAPRGLRPSALVDAEQSAGAPIAFRIVLAP